MTETKKESWLTKAWFGLLFFVIVFAVLLDISDLVMELLYASELGTVIGLVLVKVFFLWLYSLGLKYTLRRVGLKWK